ncbi:hypothetical protein ACWPOB_16525 [Rhodococcus sp. 2H158]
MYLHGRPGRGTTDLATDEVKKARAIGQLEFLGYRVTLEPVPDSA